MLDEHEFYLLKPSYTTDTIPQQAVLAPIYIALQAHLFPYINEH